MPLINYAPPVKGKREPMCKTDEATVSRIRAPFSPYDGMVERRQNVAAASRNKIQSFDIFQRQSPQEGFDHPIVRIGPSLLTYHVMKFLALRVGKALAPDNFVNARELRIFRDKDGMCTAMYSDFVSDDGGVMERRAKAMRRYYAARSAVNAIRIVANINRMECRMNPELEKCVGEAQTLIGIRIPHPEANYHLSGGRTVFFEAGGIDMRRAMTVACALRETDREHDAGDIKHAIEATAFMYALATSLVAKNKFSDGIRLPELYDATCLLMDYGLDVGQHLELKWPNMRLALGRIGREIEERHCGRLGFLFERFNKFADRRASSMLENESLA